MWLYKLSEWGYINSIDGWMGRQADRQTDRQADRQIKSSPFLLSVLVPSEVILGNQSILK